MQVSINRFCDLVLGVLLEGRDEEGRLKMLGDLDAPLDQSGTRAPTQDELDADFKAMMALGSKLS